MVTVGTGKSGSRYINKNYPQENTEYEVFGYVENNVSASETISTLSESDAIGGALDLGFKFQVGDQTLSLNSVAITGGSTNPTKIRLKNESGELIEEASISSNTATFNSPTLTAGSTYRLEAVYTTGGTIRSDNGFLTGFPITYNKFNITAMSLNGADNGNTALYAIASISYTYVVAGTSSLGNTKQLVSSSWKLGYQESTISDEVGL